jgi:hypothetical protein
MSYKKYEIFYDWCGETNDYLGSVELSIKDLSQFFKSSRGFPSILSIGSLSGEGQSGGRFITSIALKLESEIIKDIGKEKYLNRIRKLMGD